MTLSAIQEAIHGPDYLLSMDITENELKIGEVTIRVKKEKKDLCKGLEALIKKHITKI